MHLNFPTFAYLTVILMSLGADGFLASRTKIIEPCPLQQTLQVHKVPAVKLNLYIPLLTHRTHPHSVIFPINILPSSYRLVHLCFLNIRLKFLRQFHFRSTKIATTTAKYQYNNQPPNNIKNISKFILTITFYLQNIILHIINNNSFTIFTQNIKKKLYISL